MIIKKMALPRRTFLRGTGAALALPLLDAMVPALTAMADTPANPARLRRLGFVYMPMGCDVTRWTPPGDTLDQLSPSLSPLAPVKDKVTDDLQFGIAQCLSGNACDIERLVPQRGQGQTNGKHRLPSWHDGRSDRGAADWPATRNSHRWSSRWTCSRSWGSAITATPASIRTIFRGPRRRRRFRRKLTRGSCSRTSLAKRARQPSAARALKKRASLLDSVVEELARLQKSLGPGDRNRVNQYLDSVRDVERRIQHAEAVAKDNPSRGSRSPTRRSGGVCRPCSADVRPAAACAAGKHHARGYVSISARNK